MAVSNKRQLQLIQGGTATDDRGVISFINDFFPQDEGIKRIYIVENHKAGYVRAWHAHKEESKFVTVISGAAIIGAVEITDWARPLYTSDVNKYVLSANKPSVLFIPSGYANGWMSLTDDTKLMFFSDKTIDESLDDDFRFSARYWDIWNVEER